MPLEKAHGYFVHNRPLIPPGEMKREMVYRYPSPLHKTAESNLTGAPRQGQLFEKAIGSDEPDAERERNLLEQSPALCVLPRTRPAWCVTSGL